jgi:hypothetical protein
MRHIRQEIQNCIDTLDRIIKLNSDIRACQTVKIKLQVLLYDYMNDFQKIEPDSELRDLAQNTSEELTDDHLDAMYEDRTSMFDDDSNPYHGNYSEE